MTGSSTTTMFKLASITAMMLAPGVDGHAYQTKPISRQFLRTGEFNDGEVYPVEKHADAYNGGGPVVVKARQIERTDPAILEKYGGGEVWPPAAAWDLGEIASNGNYLENDDIAVSHGVCGDTPQSGDDHDIIYSTPNSEWEVLEEYDSGSIIDIDVIFTNYHWGHIEFFLCCTADLKDPSGVVTQNCLNKNPLDRADDDSYNSPVDPKYPGRYYVDPPCRKDETDQTRVELEGVLNDGHVTHMRYKLPEMTCDHAVLQMAYHSGKGCKSPGYDEFNPPSWPSECAPKKEDWIATSSATCNKSGAKYGNVFWQCSDIALRSSGAQPMSNPSPSPTEESTADAAPTATPEAPVSTEKKGAPENPPSMTPVDNTPTPEARDMMPTAAPVDELTAPRTPDAPAAPVEQPVAPVATPMSAPVDTAPVEQPAAPVATPMSAPVDTAPVEQPVAPVATPMSAPVDTAPVEQPVAPVATPMSAPVDSPTPPVSSTNECLDPVGPYEQCGGTDWTGSVCCRESYECTVMEACYSQCRPTGCAEDWEQCGGTGPEGVWTGPTCCLAGAKCTMKTEHWSMCQPDNYERCED